MPEPIPLFAETVPARPLPVLPEQTFLPDAYRLPDGATRGPTIEAAPRMVYIEVTNRCNLRCETCPRTYFDREPLKTLSYDEFVSIAEQFPALQRCALHGIGEPLLNRDLPRIIAYLKGRGVETLFNSNAALLTPAWQEALVRSGLDQYRCSIDGATRATYARIRGADALPKVLKGLRGLVETELPELVRLAAQVGAPEVYLQRMVYFATKPAAQYGMAREELAIYDSALTRQEAIIAECEALSATLGVAFHASGARDLRGSLLAQHGAEHAPWRACMRPWTTAYVTANGNCLPCCISPFSTADYDSLILGNLFERPFAELWNDAAYGRFRARLLSADPNPSCAGCGVFWSL